MLLLENELCFSHFSSIYEFLGGASIALAGFSMISKEYLNKYSLKYLSGETNRRIGVLSLEIEQFKFAQVAIKEAQNDFRYSNYIEKCILEMDQFVIENSLRDIDKEEKVFEALFYRSAIWSTFFTLSFLLLGGLEQHYPWIRLYVFNTFIWYCIEILFVLSLLLFVTFHSPRFTTVLWVKKATKFCFSNSFGMVITFILGMLTPLIITIFYPNQFSCFDWMVIFLSFISCMSFIPIYFYRYYLYLRFKMWGVNKRIDKYIIVLNNFKRLNRKYNIPENKFKKLKI